MDFKGKKDRRAFQAEKVHNICNYPFAEKKSGAFEGRARKLAQAGIMPHIFLGSLRFLIKQSQV